jgi:hypothetical protein
MQVSIVPIQYIEQVWPKIEGYMEGAAEYTYGRFLASDIKVGLFMKEQHLWVAFDDEEMYGAVVTEFGHYPQMKTLIMHFTGGKELPKWKPLMLETLQRFSKENGCKVIESYGRPGWERVFKDDGFKSRFMFYELPVEK